ncbi:MAG TPA: hypothetical protein VEU30_03585 [Thermoanaerobaculia bacterium]|nr:hypothetical protein [Thermoanaerobaculia bacterium]
MLRVPIRSRSGNVVLAVVGVVYVVSAVVALGSVFRDAVTAMGLLSGLFQITLVLALGLGGVWFVVNALENLGVTFGRGTRDAH